MLRELRIENFALIDSVQLSFSGGFNVLTGETGAGKSILVDGLALLVGGRGAADLVRAGREEAILEAVFEPPSFEPFQSLVEAELASPDEPLIIRRIISRSGKNRFYLNGHSITLSQLEAAGERLVEIHGQHTHQRLLKPEWQLAFLDDTADLSGTLADYRRDYTALTEARRRLSDLEQSDRDRALREDMLRFQLSELEGANLIEGEDEALVRDRAVLANSTQIREAAEAAYAALYESDPSVLGRLSGIESTLEKLTAFDDRLAGSLDQLRRASAELDEVAIALRQYRSGIEDDPERLARLDDRAHRLNQLKKKYGGTLDAALETLRRVRGELAGLDGRDETLAGLRSEIARLEKAVFETASRISRDRAKVARGLHRKIESELEQLKMGQTRFRVEFTRREEPGPTGLDTVSFLISPNAGEALRPLARIASGGELSRMMLALKTVLARVDPVPVLIFDEVDAGIGGAVAERVGQRLKSIASDHQVFCVTHLPQIAALASAHYRVEKRVEDGRTATTVTRLSAQDRIAEVARMLAGAEVSPTALRHAKEMISGGRSGRAAHLV